MEADECRSALTNDGLTLSLTSVTSQCDWGGHVVRRTNLPMPSRGSLVTTSNTAHKPTIIWRWFPGCCNQSGGLHADLRRRGDQCFGVGRSQLRLLENSACVALMKDRCLPGATAEAIGFLNFCCVLYSCNTSPVFQARGQVEPQVAVCECLSKSGFQISPRNSWLATLRLA